MVKKAVIKRAQFVKPSAQKRRWFSFGNSKKTVPDTPVVETHASETVENNTEPAPKKKEKKQKRQEPTEIIEQTQEDNVQKQEEIGESGQYPEQGQ